MGLNPTGLSPFLIRTSRMWYVYMCDRKGQIYTGITTEIRHRMVQHGGKLLYSEAHPNGQKAAQREKEIKGWRRERKLELIRRPR
jgi:putative endonuclease